jgi:hypothetical protein
MYSDQDPHAMKAAEMFNIPVSQVIPEQRQAGKKANYIAMYTCPCVYDKTDGRRIQNKDLMHKSWCSDQNPLQPNGKYLGAAECPCNKDPK